VLAFNRAHWTVENGCHYIPDCNWDEERCTIRTGHGPENITALRRFATGAIESKSRDTVSATIQRLARNVRLVFDYLRMTDNPRYRPGSLQAQAGQNGFAVAGLPLSLDVRLCRAKIGRKPTILSTQRSCRAMFGPQRPHHGGWIRAAKVVAHGREAPLPGRSLPPRLGG